MQHNNATLYAIFAPNLFGLPHEKPSYLAWQNPAWDEDGYFWTSEENFFDLLRNYPAHNQKPHQFAYETEAAAKTFAASYPSIHCTNYTIVPVHVKETIK